MVEDSLYLLHGLWTRDVAQPDQALDELVVHQLGRVVALLQLLEELIVQVDLINHNPR